MRLILKALPFIIIAIVLYFGSDYAKEKYHAARNTILMSLNEWEMGALDSKLDFMLNLRPKEIYDFEKFVKDNYPAQIEEYMQDAWGTAYKYEYIMREKVYRLISAGPDLEFGTGDDIIRTNEEAPE